MKQNIEVSFNAELIKSELEVKRRKAQMKLDQAVLTDSNFFCPERDSYLKKSAIADTRIGSGKVSWTVPYAKAQYYGLKNKSHLKNPNATYKWFEAAKVRNQKKWVEIVKDEYNRNS